MERNWTLLGGLPVIQKTTVSMNAEYHPIGEHVQIGGITMIFAGTQFVGFIKNGHNSILETGKNIDTVGEDIEPISSMQELVKRFYLALANETQDKVSSWIDQDLTGSKVFDK